MGIVIAIALVVLAVVRFGNARVHEPPTRPVVSPSASAGTSGTREADAAVPPAPEAGDRRSAAAPPAVVTEPKTSIAPAVLLSGKIVDPRGRALSGVGIGIAEDAVSTSLARSDAEGKFRLALERPPATLVPEGGDLVSARETPVAEPVSREPYLLIASAPTGVSGVVETPEGRPLANVRIELRALWASFLDVELPLESTRDLVWTTRSREDGQFELLRVPTLLAEALVSATKEGFSGGAIALSTYPGEPTTGLRIVLESSKPAELVVEGVVIRLEGGPVEGAQVQVGDASTITGPGGDFLLGVDPSTRAPLVAFEPGGAFALARSFPEELHSAVAGGRRSVGPIVLTLPPRSLAISGRVLDRDDAPCVGWLVYPLDGTPLSDGEGGYPPRIAEALAADGGFETTTAEDGSFRIDGLAERSYTLEARDPRTALRVASEPIAAGSEGVKLRVDRSELRTELRGTVLSKRGWPVPEVGVSVLAPFGGGKFFNGSRAFTDESGHFELRDVPRSGVILSLQGRYVAPSFWSDLPAGDGPCEIRVAATCRVQFHGSARGAALPPDRLVVEDAAGGRMKLFLYLPDGSSTASESLDLSDGRSSVFGVGESASSLVLLHGAEEVERVDLVLRPGPVHHVRL